MDKATVVPKTLTRVGVIGLSIFILLNAFAWLVLSKPAAEPFSEDWWSEWSPVGVVFLAQLCVGLAYSRFRPAPSGD